MRSRSIGCLAAAALTIVCVTGCSTTHTASSPPQYQMVQLTPVTDQGDQRYAPPSSIYLSASDEWGLAVYDYYLAYHGDIDEELIFVSADSDTFAE